jgi:hypothetical protein
MWFRRGHARQMKARGPPTWLATLGAIADIAGCAIMLWCSVVDLVAAHDAV